MSTPLVAYKDMVKVWALRSGVWGLNAVGAPAVLEAGKRGWLHREEVDAQVEQGNVQRTVGYRVENLRAPEHGPAEEAEQPVKRRRRRRAYHRRDMVAEQEPVPFINAPVAD